MTINHKGYLTIKLIIVALLILSGASPLSAQKEDGQLPAGAQFVPLLREGRMTKEYHFRSDANSEVMIVSDGIAVSLKDDGKSLPVVVPPSFLLSDVQWRQNGDCVFSDGKSIYYRMEEADSVVILVDNAAEKNLRFVLSDFGVYYFTQNGHELMFFSFSTITDVQLGQFDDGINGLAVLGDLCFVGHGKSIDLLIPDKPIKTIVPLTESPVRTLAMSPDGTLYYGTDSGLFSIDSNKQQRQISNLAVRELQFCSDDLYVIFLKGSSGLICGLTSGMKGIDQQTKRIDVRTEQARNHLLLDEVSTAVIYYGESVAYQQEHRAFGRGVDGDLLAEYAYALALHHNFDAALMNIDRARMLGAKHSDFYTAQILALMGYNDAARQFEENAEVPAWLAGDYMQLTNKYRKAFSPLLGETPSEALTHANRLASRGQTVQAITQFETLSSALHGNDADVGLVLVDYSILWEHLGKFSYATHCLSKGIELTPQDFGGRTAFENHLIKVNKANEVFANASWLKKLLGMAPPKMMAYIGASAAKDFYSLNGRMGLYTSNKFSASLNVGLNYASEQFSGSLGLSAYKAWGIFFAGLGISDVFSKDNDTFSITPSIGITLMNKPQTSSLDIMLSGYIPLSKDGKFSYSISIGKTIYFDFNKLFK